MIETSLLYPNECLVYIKNIKANSDVNGITHIAKLMRVYAMNDTIYYDIILSTDEIGNRISSNNIVTVSSVNVISNRNYVDIKNKIMYHFPLSNDITATNFAIVKKVNPLQETTRSGFGSGIYGRYIEDEKNIKDFLLNNNDKYHIIECPDAYVLQDREHGDSLTLASLTTNSFLDDVIHTLNTENTITKQNISLLLNTYYFGYILTLWNIFLYRTMDKLTIDDLNTIFTNYLYKYMTDDTLYDSLTNEKIFYLPVNNILKYLGYDGVLATDTYNNGWNRGCVSYNYKIAKVINGTTSTYQ